MGVVHAELGPLEVPLYPVDHDRRQAEIPGVGRVGQVEGAPGAAGGQDRESGYVATFSRTDGLDPIGLEGGLVNATLDVGGWSATHYYGWSEFEIDAVTQELTITTWGTDFLVPVTPPVVINRVRVQAQ